MSEGLHWTPCRRGSALPLLVVGGGIAALVFWPTVVAVAATVALIVKVILIALAVAAVLGITAVAIAAVRQRRQPAAPVLTVRPAAPAAVEPALAEQLAALTAAVTRLERGQQAALPASARPIVIDQQALCALLDMAAERRELAERWDAR